MFKGGKRQVRGRGREKRGGRNSLNRTPCVQEFALQCCVFVLAIISIAHFWDRLRA